MKLNLSAILMSVCIISCCLLGAEKASAAVTLRTSAVDTINSITTEAVEVTTVTQGSSSPIAIYSLTFSLKAFGGDMAIPKGIVRKTDSIATNTLSFILENRNKKEISSGFALATLIPTENSVRDTTSYFIPKGDSRSFTALIAYTDTEARDPENRVRITEMPLFQYLKEPVLLNQSELQRLKTDYIELY